MAMQVQTLWVCVNCIGLPRRAGESLKPAAWPGTAPAGAVAARAFVASCSVLLRPIFRGFALGRAQLVGADAGTESITGGREENCIGIHAATAGRERGEKKIASWMADGRH